MPPKRDLVFNNAPNDVKTDHPEDRVSDLEDEFKTKAPQKVTSFVQSTEQVKSPRLSVQHVETSIPAAKSTSSKPTCHGKCRNRKACFVPVSTTVPKLKVTRPRQDKPIVTKPNLPNRRHITHSPSPKASNSLPRVTAVQALMVNAAQGNMSYLSNFKELNSGYVSFGRNPKSGLENQLSLKVKVIRSDNGTKFKNNDLNQFCGMKGIKREFSVPKTPQQNGIAERKNRTLIEAARTMLADSLLPILFWFAAVNTACCVHNRVLVTKPHNKTPYELLHGRTPSIGFIRLFGCPMTILNTLDSLGKFNRNVDKGFLNTDRDVALDEKEHKFEEKKPESKVNVSHSSSAQSKKHDDKTKKEAKGKSHVESLIGYINLSVEFEDFFDNNVNKDNAAGTLVPTVGQISPNSTNTFSAAGLSNADASPAQGKSSSIDTSQLPDDPDMPELEDITYSDDDDDSAFLYVTIEEEVYVCQPLGFKDPDYPDKKGDTLLVQIYVDDIIFGSTNKELCKSFEKLMKDKFQMSSIGELTFFLDLQVKQNKDGIFISQDKYVTEILRKFRLTDGKSACTPIDTKKPLLKDPDGEDVDVHTYTSMIVAYSDSDYAGASLDRKSTTGGCQFLGYRLISLQCKKQIVVATSSTEAEYVAAASCCAQVLWIQNQLLNYGYNVTSPRCNEDRLVELTIFLLPSDEKVRVEVSAVDLQLSAVRLILLLLVQKFLLFGLTNWCCSLNAVRKQVGDLLTHTIKYTSSALTHKVFANMRRVGKGFFRVETPLFEGMLVAQEVGEGVANEVNNEGVHDVGVATEGVVSTTDDVVPTVDEEPSIPSPTPPTLLITSNDVSNQGRMIADMDADVDVVLEEAKDVAADDKDDQDADVQDNADIQERTADTTITAANVLILAATTAVALTLTAAPSKRTKELEAVLNRNIDWEEVIDHVNKKAKEYPAVKRYQALKRKPQTEAQARKNMIYRKQQKRKKLDEEVEELKRHLQIVPNEDDDVYTKATTLARKVYVVDYEIYNENNKPYIKIKRADERKYPLTKFTLNQMLTNVRLEVKEESEVSLELLSFGVDAAMDFKENMVLVTKPQNKTPYELLNGTQLVISYLRPFGCHVTILSTIDQLGKFYGKSDSGFLVRYSLNSKAFRVYNLETKRVEENMHVNFLENKPNIVGIRHAWMFDLDYLTNSMNYEPVSLENQANKSAGPQEANNSAGSQANADQEDKIQKTTDCKTCETPVSQVIQIFQEELEKLKRQEKKANDSVWKEATHETQDVTTNSTNLLNTISAPTSVVGPSRALNDDEASYPDDPSMPYLEDIYASPSVGIFTDSSYDDKGVVTDFNNLETTMTVSPTPTTRIHTIHPKTQILRDPLLAVQTRSKVHKNYKARALKMKVVLMLCKRNCCSFEFRRQEEGIDYDEVFALVASIEAIRIFIAFASYMGFIVYQMDVKNAFLYGTINEEVYVTKTLRFVDPKFPNKVYKVVKALYGLHQAPRAWYATLFTFLEKSRYKIGAIDKTLFIKQGKKDIMLVHVYADDIIFGSTKMSWCEEFKELMKNSMKTASTLIETQKPLVKNEEAANADIPVSSFDLEAYSDSDYTGVNLDKKSTIGGCQFLGRRLISWQCKKQTIMAISTIEAEYVVAAHYCGKVLWIQTTLLKGRLLEVTTGKHSKELASPKQMALGVNTPRCDEDSLELKELMVFFIQFMLRKIELELLLEASIRHTLKLDDEEGTSYLANDEFFTGLANMGYVKISDKLTFYKAFFSPQCTMASAIFCLAINKKFNFSRYILLSLVKNIEDGVPFYMFPWFVQLIFDHQLGDMSHHLDIYDNPSLTMKVFTNIKRVGTGFSRVITPLFENMLVPVAEEEDMDEDVEVNLEESHGKTYNLDLQHSEKVLSMQDINKEEPAKVEEVLEVVTTAKLITKVVTTAEPTTAAAQVPKASAPRRRSGVVIQDPEETAASVTVHIKNDVIEQVKRSKRQNNSMMGYQALKRKPLTEGQGRKNMIIYLKNMAGFKMNFFKGMTYSEIRPLFEKHYNLNQAFLDKVEEEVTVQEKENKIQSESLEQEIAKKQRIDEEEKVLKRHLQIVSNDDDDVYT
nr:ribonuclease H-like domain-containing protein [Tanacetum cinerariifolium]